MRTVLVCSLVVSTACVAAAQDAPARTVRDEWYASYASGEKSHWEHYVLVEHPGQQARFVETTDLWYVATKVREVVRKETDARGRILSYDKTLHTPWGNTTAKARKDGDVLRYSFKIRELPERTGTVEQAVWNPNIVALLVQRGELPQGSRSLLVLDLPGEGKEEKDYEIRKVDGRWKTDTKYSCVWRSADGTFERSEKKSIPNGEALPATAKTASDLNVKGTPAADGVRLDRVGGASLGLLRPKPSVGWRLQSFGDEGPKFYGVEHITGAGLLAMTMPFPVPEDPKRRIEVGEHLIEGLNGTDNPMRLGEPRITTWRGKPALRFTLGGELAGAPVGGEAYLVSLAPSETYLVVVGYPADLKARCEPLLEAALGVMELSGTQPKTQWKRVSVIGALSIEVPADWKRQPGTDTYTSPSGASLVKVSTFEFPANGDVGALLSSWVRMQKGNKALENVELESQESGTDEGREVHTAVLKGLLKAGKLRPQVRVGDRIWQDGERLIEVLVLLSETDSDLQTLEHVFKSARWARTY